MSNISDKLNIGSIACSAVLAYFFPLELFIFAYAILGPLHYVTEINWLNNKSYFFSSKSWIWLLVGTTASLILFIPKLYLEYGNAKSGVGEFMTIVTQWSNSAIFLALLLALAYQFNPSKVGWAIVSVIGAIGAILLRQMEYYNIVIGMMIPTVIHVYLFTLIFMLYGAKKSNSKFGYLSVIFAVVAPLLFIYAPIAEGQYLFSDALKNLYLENRFHVTPVIFSKLIGLSDGTTFYFYEQLELRLMMFMSFIYCYHYLNWFSKTTVIKWHKMLNLRKTIAIVVIWIASLLLYFYDFRLGFLVSLFLSFMHVILEFPLNILSIRGILFPVRQS